MGLWSRSWSPTAAARARRSPSVYAGVGWRGPGRKHLDCHRRVLNFGWPDSSRRRRPSRERICFPFEKLSEETGPPLRRYDTPAGTTISLHHLPPITCSLVTAISSSSSPSAATTVSRSAKPPSGPPSPLHLSRRPSPRAYAVQVWMLAFDRRSRPALYVSTRAGDEGPWELTGPLDMSRRKPFAEQLQPACGIDGNRRQRHPSPP